MHLAPSAPSKKKFQPFCRLLHCVPTTPIQMWTLVGNANICLPCGHMQKKHKKTLRRAIVEPLGGLASSFQFPSKSIRPIRKGGGREGEGRPEKSKDSGEPLSDPLNPPNTPSRAQTSTRASQQLIETSANMHRVLLSIWQQLYFFETSPETSCAVVATFSFFFSYSQSGGKKKKCGLRGGDVV